jgi:hypothetical protein
MDLTPSHPTTPGDEPPGEPTAQTAEPTADADADADAAGAQAEQRSHEHPQQAEPLPHDGGTASRSPKEIGGKKFRVGAEDDYVPFRSRTKRRRRMIAAGAAGLVLVGAGAYGVASLVSSPSQDSTAGGCASNANTNAGAGTGAGANAAAAMLPVTGQLPTAAQIKLNVYNSTNRHGLAANTASTLKQRGFTIGKVTNDPLKANLTVAAEVRGASASAAAMQVVAAEVLGSDARTDGTVDLVLGSGFTALANPDQVSAALKQDQQAEQQHAASPKAAGNCS